jgi:hypothetical protein
VPPGVGADDQVRVGGADRLDERHRAPDLLGHGDLGGRAGGHAADVQDVGAFGHHGVHMFQRGTLVPGDAGPVEGVRGPVDDGHDQQPGGRELLGAEAQRTRLAVRGGTGYAVVHAQRRLPSAPTLSARGSRADPARHHPLT